MSVQQNDPDGAMTIHRSHSGLEVLCFTLGVEREEGSGSPTQMEMVWARGLLIHSVLHLKTQRGLHLLHSVRRPGQILLCLRWG